MARTHVRGYDVLNEPQIPEQLKTEGPQTTMGKWLLVSPVVISTCSRAAPKRNFPWSVAAIAGLLAIAFAIYVFRYM